MKVRISRMLALLLISVTIFTSCGGSDMPANEALNYFATQVNDGNLKNYRLVIYVFDLNFHPFAPPSTVRGIRRNEHTTRIVVGGGWLESTLMRDTNLLNQMSKAA